MSLIFVKPTRWPPSRENWHSSRRSSISGMARRSRTTTTTSSDYWRCRHLSPGSRSVGRRSKERALLRWQTCYWTLHTGDIARTFITVGLQASNHNKSGWQKIKLYRRLRPTRVRRPTDSPAPLCVAICVIYRKVAAEVCLLMRYADTIYRKLSRLCSAK